MGQPGRALQATPSVTGLPEILEAAKSVSVDGSGARTAARKRVEPVIKAARYRHRRIQSHPRGSG